MAEGARLESVCGGNSTAGSNPALSERSPQGAHPGARALCIVALRTVSDPEGSSTKEDTASAAGSLGSMVGSPSILRPGSPSTNRASELLLKSVQDQFG